MRGVFALTTAAILIAVLTLHTTVLEKIALWGAKPDLMLAIVVYVALMRGPVAGVAVGFTLGLLQDAQSHHALGLNALAKSVSGFAAGYTWEGLARESVMTQMTVILGAGILHSLIFFTLYVGSEPGAAVALTAKIGIPGALYTAVLAPGALAILQGAFGFRVRFNGKSGR